MLNVLFAIVVVAFSSTTTLGEWHTYHSEKYGYEIRYPDSFEAVITGPEQDRDDTAIRIALKSIARPHGIDVEIRPGMSLAEILSSLEAPELDKIEGDGVTMETELHRITWRKVRDNGLTAVKMQNMFTENNEVFMTSLIMDQVVLSAHLYPDAGLDETLAERIISTFKRDTGTSNTPDAGGGK